MNKPDRLSALISRFELQAEIVTDVSNANFFLFCSSRSGELSRIEFWPKGAGVRPEMDAKELLVAASISMGGDVNPLALALPNPTVLTVEEELAIKGLGELILSEVSDARCGRQTTLRRLFEVLVVLILRQAIQKHSDKKGLLAGLADDRICRSIVAIHEQPGFDWNVEDLADRTGLSRSQFMERFKSCVGQTPAHYLREWRLTLARQDLEKGERVKTVAQRYGYKSQEALSRAFSQRFQCSPSQYRP